MARPPVREPRQRVPGNHLAVQDGFAGARIAPQQNRNVQAEQDNSEAAHFAAIMNSDLQDRITDDEAMQLAAQRRISDNFGPELAAYRRELAGQGGLGPQQAAPAPIPVNPRLGYNAAPPRVGHHPGGNRPVQNGYARPGQLAVQNAPRNALAQAQANPRRPTDWFQLRTLDPYSLTQIRALGRQIFDQYAGHVQLEDINCMSAQVHDPAHVRDTIRWIVESGNEIVTENLDFNANIPGYRAAISVWEVERFNFMIVRDNHGEYVYGWPAAPRPALENRPDNLRLR